MELGLYGDLEPIEKEYLRNRNAALLLLFAECDFKLISNYICNHRPYKWQTMSYAVTFQ